jgi:Zn-dependent protease
VNRTGVRPSPIFLIFVAAAVIGGVLTTLDSQAAVNGGTLLLVLAGWGVSLCLHEFGHAIVAYRGGDYSVRAKGYLTLDIRRYTDPVLSIVLPLVWLVIGGIPLPGGAVWINHHALRSRKVDTMVSLAGPLFNLVVGIVLTQLVRLIPVSLNDVFSNRGAIILVEGLSFLALLQILAFILNILPIPGLDGWGAIEPYLSAEAKRFGNMVRPWGMWVLFLLLFLVPSVNHLFFDITDHVFQWVGGQPLLAQFGNDNFLFWRN